MGFDPSRARSGRFENSLANPIVMTRPIHLAALVFALTVLVLFPKWTVDDAYITFRYAENLARHGELTWNVGEDPVEGYTGVALPLILAGWIRLGGEPETASAFIGVVSLFACGFLMVRILRLIEVDRRVRAVACALFFTAPFLYTHAFSGLETLLFAAALTAALLALLHRLRSDDAAPIKESLLALALLACGLIRPEGVALAGTFAAALALVLWRRSRRSFRGWAIRFGFLYAIPAAGYFLWRYHYYGQLLPNTFHAKSFDGAINFESVKSLGLFIYTYLTAPAIAALLIVLGGRVHANGTGEDPSQTPSRRFALPAFWACGAFLVVLVAQYSRSRLIMNFADRFFVPIFPFLLIGLGVVASRGIEAGVGHLTVRVGLRRAVAIPLLLLAIGQAAIHGVKLRDQFQYTATYRTLMHDQHFQAADFLISTLPRDEVLVSYMDVGALAYRTGLKTIDFGRLNDETLASGDLDESEVVDYFYAQDAGAVVMTSHDWREMDFTPEAAAITADPRFARYALARKYRSGPTAHPSREFQFVFLRQDLHAKYVASAPNGGG